MRSAIPSGSQLQKLDTRQKQIVEVNGFPRHLKRRPQYTQPLWFILDVETEMSKTDTCHENAENHEDQSKDVSESNEENIEAEKRPQEIDVSLRHSTRGGHMPLSYLY